MNKKSIRTIFDDDELREASYYYPENDNSVFTKEEIMNQFKITKSVFYRIMNKKVKQGAWEVVKKKRKNMLVPAYKLSDNLLEKH